MGSRELRQPLRRLLRTQRPYSPPPDPDLPLDALVRLRMENLEKRLDELKGRVNGLLWTFAGAVAADLGLRLLG